MKNELARRKALADAAAGVVGSLASMLVFYPVDVWKTNLQAGRQQNSNCVDEDVRETYKLSTLQWMKQLFRGLPYKIAHTTVSSFTYFFVYSLVQSKYRAHIRLLASRHGGIDKSSRISTITKLSLAAFSAMINTCITLPLDTLSSRMQAGSNQLLNVSSGEDMSEGSICPCSNKLNQVGELDYVNTEASPNKSITHLSIRVPKNFKCSFSTNLLNESFTTNQLITHQRVQSMLSLWNGLLPAILLCSNPAIQYTMYDTVKSSLLVHRQQNRAQSGTSSLSMIEAFACGLISKFVATIVTYPLIRAKVMMMVAPTAVSHNDFVEESKMHCDNAEAKNTESELAIELIKHPRSLPLLFMYIFKKNGIRGLYRGCSLQLLHTVLKSALLLMIREKINVVTRRFFQVEDT